MAGFGHIEFHVDDLDRVIQFYWAVFGWDILDVSEAKEKKATVVNEIKWPENSGPIISEPLRIEGVELPKVLFTVEVSSIPETLSRISLWDGEIILTEVVVPGKGAVAYCKDTEGNLFSILQPDRSV